MMDPLERLIQNICTLRLASLNACLALPLARAVKWTVRRSAQQQLADRQPVRAAGPGRVYCIDMAMRIASSGLTR